MAPVAPNLTGRYYLDYTTGRLEHTMQMRFNGATPLTNSADFGLLAFLQSIAALLPTAWRPIRARWSAPGSNITLPIVMPADLANFQGDLAGLIPEEFEPRESVWVGRSPTTGRRVRLSVYGASYATPVNYRFGPGESGLTDPTTLSALNDEPDLFVTADGSEAQWYSYVNVNFNSYWEGRARL